MRSLQALGIYIAVVFVGGPLLAPWLYRSVQAAHAFPGLAHQPFDRFVHRALLLLALAALWPLLRALGATSLREIGLVRPTGYWRILLSGFLLGFTSLALVGTVTLVAGGRTFNRDNDPLRLTEKIVNAALSAVVVALLEETLFRGGIFGALRRVFHWFTALAASSMIYAILHFLESATHQGPVSWWSGLELLPRMMRGFMNWDQLVPGFFNLSLAGALLALAYQRTGNLYLSIGLHAGWVFWLKSYRALTADVAGANLWFWGTRKLIDGWLALVVLALTMVVFTRLPLARVPDSDP